MVKHFFIMGLHGICMQLSTTKDRYIEANWLHMCSRSKKSERLVRSQSIYHKLKMFLNTDLPLHPDRRVKEKNSELVFPQVIPVSEKRPVNKNTEPV